MISIDFGSGYAPKEGYKTCDMTGMPFLDYTFDPVEYKMECDGGVADEINCRNVLHHIKDLERVFAEFDRVMAPGAKLVITEPRQSYYQANYILDILWYRYVIPRHEVWIAPEYRDFITVAKFYFEFVSYEVAEEKEIVIFKKR